MDVMSAVCSLQSAGLQVWTSACLDGTGMIQGFRDWLGGRLVVEWGEGYIETRNDSASRALLTSKNRKHRKNRKNT